MQRNIVEAHFYEDAADDPLLLVTFVDSIYVVRNMYFWGLLIPFVASLPATRNRLAEQRPLVHDGLQSMPLLGFGTWNLHGDNATKAVSIAIQSGYRHIDCATAYGNQKEVGAGIADGLQKTGLKRENIWVTSKLWNTQFVFPLTVAPEAWS